MMINKKATVTVRRLSGEIETVESNHARINPALFGLMEEATRKAGRGELLSYTNPTLPEFPEKLNCDRCGAEVDESAYSQTEKDYYCGGPVTVTAHYCKACERTLKAVGAGEHSAMDDRR